MVHTTRRTLLQAGAATLAGAAAGCLGSASPPPTDSTGTTAVRSSFFVTGEFVDAVAGDAASTETVVPLGQHGHGWEPGPDVQRSVLNGDVFVIVGEGFQPWADRLVDTLAEDAPEISVVESWHDVALLPAGGHDETETATDGDQHGDHGQHDDHEDHHDHGPVDPHFWLDLQRAQQAVDTIAEGLAAADGANAAAYRENATAYRDRLDALDRRFERTLADRTRDTVLVAGHDSFQYLGDRYGFHVEALTGISPDASPSPSDVRRAQALIEEHDITHVLAPVFESDRAARMLVEETDAEAVRPLTPVPTLTNEWAENGWGFVEVMEQVNLASLRDALGVE